MILADRRRCFAAVLLIELWERFGYYGVQSLLLLFMVQRLGFADHRANLLLGAFGALVYAAPAVGGLIGDQLLGARRTMLLGGVTLMVAYALLAVPGDGAGLLYLAMATVVIGNGLFKSNAANLVRRIYEGDDAQLDAAFTIYYMAINVGSTLSTLLSPWLKDRYGWHLAFGVSAVGLAAGLAGYLVMRRRVGSLGSPRDFTPLHRRGAAAVLAGMLATIVVVRVLLQHAGLARGFVWLAGLAVLATWIWLYRRSHAAERAGLLIMYLLTAEVMLFFIFYQQSSTSLTLFALREVSLDFSLAGWHLFTWSPAQFAALDPIWIVLLTPLLVRIYNRLAARGHDPSIAQKFVAGFGFVAAAFLLWWLAAAWSGSHQVSPWVMVWAYGLFSAGELLISGLGLAVTARYVPARMSGFMMGSYFVAVGVSLYAGSAVANLAAASGDAATGTIGLYVGLFRNLFMLASVGVLLSLLLLPWLARLDHRHLQQSLRD